MTGAALLWLGVGVLATLAIVVGLRVAWFVDPESFEAQNAAFVAGTQDGLVQFGYVGQRTADVATGISIEDVRWLCRYLVRLTDIQLRAALDASGASADETERFTRAIRQRIDRLVGVAR